LKRGVKLGLASPRLKGYLRVKSWLDFLQFCEVWGRKILCWGNFYEQNTKILSSHLCCWKFGTVARN